MSDERLTTRVSAIEQAAQQENLSQVTALWKSLQAELAQASVQALLDQFKAEVEAGDYQQAGELYAQIQARYNERNKTEQKQQGQALLAREQPETSSEQRDTLRELLSQVPQTQQARRGFLIAGGGILAEETTPREFSSVVEESTQAEQEIASAQVSAAPVIETISRPPEPTITSVDPRTNPIVGTASDVAVTVANTGTAPASGVIVTLTAPAEVTVENGQSSLGSLAGGAERTIVSSISPSQSGEQMLTATVSTAEAGGDTQSLSITVDSTGFSIARFDRDADGQIGFDDLRYATREYNRDSITFDQLRRVVQAYNEGKQV